MLRYLKSSFWSFCSIFIRTIGSLGINKLIALYYGPNGITLYAHFQNLVSIVTTVPDGGINIGTIKFLANQDPDSQQYRQYFWAGIWLNLLCVALALALIFSFSDYYLGVFLEEVGLLQWWWIAGFGGGSLLLTYNLFLQAMLLSKRVLQWHVVSTSTMSLAGLAVVYFFGGKLSAGMLLPLLLAAQCSTFFLMLPVLTFKKLITSFRLVKVPQPVYLEIGKYMVMALSAVVCLKLTNFFVRDFVIGRLDLYETGLWQAVVRVSENYTLVYTSVIGMLYYPRMAALITEQDVLRRYVRSTFYLVMPAIAIALLLVYLLREWVLLLLFNQDFVVAEYLFSYQLLGDFFKMWSIVLTNLMVVRAHVRLYISWQIITALFYMVLVYNLVEPFGLEGITIAHAIRYGAVLVFSMVYYNKYIRL
ncbi:hypothetical protein FVR03_09855 [Pontibacter qinzhouensis]|uniref:O-antigen translocase n=1 Tax=Pontibacter qinzhouensis TaxID=2603253 RepID=A0A5C8K7L3_9BACT|nr:hypothetical protein [Pontibacter qinzhouensis]TXK47142.1 hypothetical protein FVR03_09855 [Pontibacter qinzhouensis]